MQENLGSPEAQAAAFRIVTFHKPPYTHLWDLTGLFCAYSGETFVRNDWVPLFEFYGVDLVVAGHAHAYQRATRNGVIYLTVGGGGGPSTRSAAASGARTGTTSRSSSPASTTT